MTPGTVYLVGAGPGDPGLVTLRARELIGDADVLVYDYLVHPELRTWCRSDCEVVYVGKQRGFHAKSQDEIEALLVDRARKGKRVVRLKGGDPFVFGRGGEEARTLARDGIPFQVVPGVTAAVAAGAYAGIPLTLRNTSTAVAFLTGHEDATKHARQVDWKAFGALKNTTLAVYMGMGHLAEIMDGLLAGGLDPATPAAAVQWASLGRQRTLVATAGTLAAEVTRAGVSSPAVVLIGEAVRCHAEAAWFEKLPLKGRRVVLTRAREQSGGLRRRLEELGAEVIEMPLIRVVPDVNPQELVDILAELGTYDWMVFTSPNGVRYFFEHYFRAFDEIRTLGLLRFACVGESTAREIRKLRLRVECMPKTATAEALAEAMIATGSLDSAKVVVVTGNLNRDVLVRKLEEARAIVDRLPMYRTEKPALAGDPQVEDYRVHGADAVLFASSSAADAWADNDEALRIDVGGRRPLLGSMGGQTSATLRARGLRVDFEAAEPGVDGLVDALVRALEAR
jgi:uroporphyrinogen III methyltransferase / synthase